MSRLENIHGILATGSVCVTNRVRMTSTGMEQNVARHPAAKPQKECTTGCHAFEVDGCAQCHAYVSASKDPN